MYGTCFVFGGEDAPHFQYTTYSICQAVDLVKRRIRKTTREQSYPREATVLTLSEPKLTEIKDIQNKIISAVLNKTNRFSFVFSRVFNYIKLNSFQGLTQCYFPFFDIF